MNGFMERRASDAACISHPMRIAPVQNERILARKIVFAEKNTRRHHRTDGRATTYAVARADQGVTEFQYAWLTSAQAMRLGGSLALPERNGALRNKTSRPGASLHRRRLMKRESVRAVVVTEPPAEPGADEHVVGVKNRGWKAWPSTLRLPP